MDLLKSNFRSKAGNIGLLRIVEYSPKFQFLNSLKKFSSNKICDFLQIQVFFTFGVPELILTDNGSQFCSSLFQAFLTRFDVSHKCTAIYSPQANASERLNHLVLAAIRAYIAHTNLDTNLIEIDSALRSAIFFYERLRKLNLLIDDTRIDDRDCG